MADGSVTLNPGAGGGLVDVETLSTGSGNVNRQRVRIGGAAGTDLATVNGGALSVAQPTTTVGGTALVGTYPNAPVNVAAAAADTQLLGANAARRGGIISNDSTAKLYVLLDQSGSGVASSTKFTYVVQPGGTLELPQPIYAGRIRGIWTAANGSAGVTEIT